MTEAPEQENSKAPGVCHAIRGFFFSGPSPELTPEVSSPMRMLCQVAVLLVAVVVAYGRTLGYGLVDWDDPVSVSSNPFVMSPSWDNLIALWTRPYSDLYIPAVYTSYIFDLLVGRGSFAALHAGNLVYHFLAAVVVHRLLVRLCGDSLPALLGALVFVVHPLQTEPVAWVTGRKDVLSGMCILVAVYQADCWLTGKGWKHYGAATFALIFALLAKPSAITAPLLVALLALYRGRPARFWLGALAPWFVLTLAWAAFTAHLQSDVQLAPFWIPLYKRLFVAADSLLFYVQKLVVPVGLGPIYPRTNRTLFETPWIWFELPVAVALFAALVAARGKTRLAAGLFVIPLLPVLGIAPFFFQYHSNVADRYCYVSLAGAGLGAAAGLSALLRWRPGMRTPILVTAWAVVLVLAAASARQCQFWKDSRALWTRELAINPRSTSALFNLGMDSLDRGMPEQALAYFQDSIRADPTFARGQINTILLARQLGQLEAARKAAEAALKLQPKSEDEWLAVGHAWTELGNHPKAAEAFLEAVNQMPDDPDAHSALGLELLQLRDPVQAEKAFREAIRLNPRDAALHAHLARALMVQRRGPEAASALRDALALDPGNAEFRQLLAQLGASP